MAVTEDRFTGALVGLAVGDALGVPLEFAPRDALPPVSGMSGGGRFQLDPGQWTDDTSMALCLATSLIDTGEFDLRDQLKRFVRWRDEGYLTSTGRCFGIGQQTFRALSDFTATGQVVSRLNGARNAGNGSLMRLAPVPMVFCEDLEAAARASAASSLTTHPSTECQEACATYGRLIAGALQGWDRDAILAESRALARQVSSSSVRHVLEAHYLDKTRDEISSSGYVVDTMEAALWAFMQADDFPTGALLAVNLGHDADTVGAVYGEIAGAHFGLSGIPLEWREHLHEADRILGIARQLRERTSTVRVSEESAAYLVAQLSIETPGAVGESDEGAQVVTVGELGT